MRNISSHQSNEKNETILLNELLIEHLQGHKMLAQILKDVIIHCSSDYSVIIVDLFQAALCF